MRLRISVRGRVPRSVGASVPCYFRTTNIAVFEGIKSSNDIINNGTMSDDEVVASDVPPRYLLKKTKLVFGSFFFFFFSKLDFQMGNKSRGENKGGERRERKGKAAGAIKG